MCTSRRNPGLLPFFGFVPALVMTFATAALAAAPSGGLGGCVEGRWEPIDLEEFYDGLLVGDQEGEELDLDIEVSETRGTLTYAFLPNGRVEAHYDVTIVMRVEDTADSGYRFKGTMRTTWQAEGGVLRMGAPDASDLLVVVQMEGRDIGDPQPVGDMLALREWQGGSAYRVTCRGDEMTLKRTEPTALPESRLRRVR